MTGGSGNRGQLRLSMSRRMLGCCGCGVFGWLGGIRGAFLLLLLLLTLFTESEMMFVSEWT